MAAVSARALFAPLGPTYDRYASRLSFGQDPRWRRFLVSRIEAGPADTVLDVATGTGAVALELVRAKGCRVVGLDQSPEMLAEARRRLPSSVTLVEGTADELPFPDAAFDALTGEAGVAFDMLVPHEQLNTRIARRDHECLAQDALRVDRRRRETNERQTSRNGNTKRRMGVLLPRPNSARPR